jgi:predicted Zn-dependent protease
MRIPMLASMLAALALGAVNPILGSGALMATLSGFAQDNINFVRSNEKQADSIGIDMLIKSGLDPRGMASFFKKMQQSARYYYTANTPAILRSHPLDEDRIAEAENRSLHLGVKNHIDSLDYRLFKELIRATVTRDTKQLLDYYRQLCFKSNNDIACVYGDVLALMNINQYSKAETNLAPLLTKNPDNLYFAITMSQIDVGEKKYDQAITRLSDLQQNFPDNYAALISYAQILVDANQPGSAAKVLLQGTRQFPRDLPMCQQYARAEAANHHEGYAYFIEAQCHLLQGRKKEALGRLKTAKTLVNHDHMLQERIDAKMDEVKFLLEK